MSPSASHAAVVLTSILQVLRDLRIQEQREGSDEGNDLGERLEEIERRTGDILGSMTLSDASQHRGSFSPGDDTNSEERELFACGWRNYRRTKVGM